MHTIILEKQKQTKQDLSSITIEYIFLQKEIRYLIPPTINTHIDCLKNSKSVFSALSKQQQGALKVCCAGISVIAHNGVTTVPPCFEGWLLHFLLLHYYFLIVSHVFCFGLLQIATQWLAHILVDW